MRTKLYTTQEVNEIIDLFYQYAYKCEFCDDIVLPIFNLEDKSVTATWSVDNRKVCSRCLHISEGSLPS